MNQRIGLLNRIKHLLPLDARVALYNALIRPHFDFADTILGDRDNITLMHDLQVLQNKAAKVILDLPNYASSTDALKTLGWPTFSFKSALYIDTLPLLSTSTDLWITILKFSETQTSIVITLEEGTISVFLSLKGITHSRDFFYQCTKEWNILDTSFKEINSLLLFKQNVKSYIFWIFYSF